jgi:hypothetical protein
MDKIYDDREKTREGGREGGRRGERGRQREVGGKQYIIHFCAHDSILI